MKHVYIITQQNSEIYWKEEKKKNIIFRLKKEEEEFLAIQSARDFAQLIWSGLKQVNANSDLQLSFVQKVNS